MVFAARRLADHGAPGVHCGAHFSDGGLESDEDRLGDEEMADIEFHDLRQTRDDPCRLVVEPMAGMAFDAHLGRFRRCRAQPREFAVPPGALAPLATALHQAPV